MDEEISDGVKILCDRMESNPEEFAETEFDPATMHRKLGKFYYEGKEIESLAKGESAGKEHFWYLNGTEKKALVTAYVTMMRKRATQRVVEKLLAPPEDDDLIRFKTGARPITKQMLLDEMTPGLNELFEKEYIKYKASGRYVTGFDGDPLINPWK